MGVLRCARACVSVSVSVCLSPLLLITHARTHPVHDLCPIVGIARRAVLGGCGGGDDAVEHAVDGVRALVAAVWGGGGESALNRSLLGAGPCVRLTHRSRFRTRIDRALLMEMYIDEGQNQGTAHRVTAAM